VLDLKSGVHFKEVEALVFINKELNSTSALVAASFCKVNCLFSHFVSSHLVHENGGGLLYYLLVSALYRALTFGHVNVVAMFVTENLKLDMFGFLNIFLNEDSTISKGGDGFVTRELKTFNRFLIVESNTHTFATTTS